MGTYSDWLDKITDPSVIEAELYQALQDLDADIDKLYDAGNIIFTYDSFYSDEVTDVAGALIEIGEYLATLLTTGGARQLVTVPSRAEVLVDATNIFSFIVMKDSPLGLAHVYLETAPPAAIASLQIMKNGVSAYLFDVAIGDHGPFELDLSFISVVIGDIVTLRCVTASGAAGLAFAMEF